MSTLFELVRDGVPEVHVRGALAWATPGRVLGGVEPERGVFARSTIKPLAAKATWEGLRDLPDAAVALAAASHDGTAAHGRAARALAGADAAALRTPASLPLAQARLRLSRPDRWRHPCSGEHAGILHACRAVGWDTSTYLDPGHPRQGAVRAWQRRVLGEGWAPRRVATDGCGLPTDALTLGELARLYAAVARWRHEDRVWDAMIAHPDVVGGEGRLDTSLLRAGGGRLVAKEGADGLLAVAIADPRWPDGLGLVVKIDHGWDPGAAARVAQVALGAVGLEVPGPGVPRGQVLVVAPGVAQGPITPG